mmetsp:Transcript_90422/g.195678  ORF Transcript_90422/g.195678 Transcript_90422/m.195678 type:complete len:205 (-) Transcript_90422:117-731(-)
MGQYRQSPPMSTRCQEDGPRGPSHWLMSTARPKSTRPKWGCLASPHSRRMLCEFTSRWKAWAPIRSSVGPSCRISCRARRLPRRTELGPSCFGGGGRRRKASSGSPGTLAMARRIRVPSLRFSTVWARYRGMRITGAASPGPWDARPRKRSSSDCSSTACCMSAGLEHEMSLSATSRRSGPLTTEPLQTSLKEPLPRTPWHLTR